ncbi:NAD(P)H-quinone oxidoreductase [Geminicoccus flavidas]|uniref:NAD(P)H-quinone oxidoreductase n=1 Tax=Geminicoccus flavidas TaxID=2506407 RepID=UPI00135866FC|nr:NAD(P)H-quinone oxidoreductase [Geminicoccus flavidas]
MSDQLPSSMRHVRITRPGGPEVLEIARMPVPQPGPGEVLIRVASAGVNRPDVFQRMGAYPPPPGASDVPGLEVAGEVVALGQGVAGVALGDAVCALVASGGYAEYCTAPAEQVLPVPEGWGTVEAGGLPETFFTVWTNVFQRGRLRQGERFLVHGGSSGIGVTAIQLAYAFGAQVFATAGSPDKVRACEELGATRGIDYRREDFVAVVREATGGKGVDLILDMVGGSYVSRNLDAAAVEGRIVQIAWLEGSRVEADFTRLMAKRLTWTGSTLRPRSVAEKGQIARELHEQVWPVLSAGRIRPVVHAVLPLDQVVEAHRLMESSAHIGKILLVP